MNATLAYRLSLLLFLTSRSVNAAEAHRYLYASSPDGAQSEGRSGEGILVFDARSKKQVATLRDEKGNAFASSKFIEIQFKNGHVTRMGNEFGLGRVHTQ